MKRGIAILLAVLMALSLTACTRDYSAELAALQAQLEQMQKQLDVPPASESSAQQDALPEDETIYLFNAQADGQHRVAFKGHTTVTAQAVIPEGMALEAWVRDGAVLTGEEDDLLTLNADATTFVEARLRPERTVRTINAQMRFLDEHDKPKGETFEEFVFEYGYENPVTEQWHESGAITVYVEAVVPRGYVIDHWVINDVPYYFNKTVSAFTVVELDESTVYEAVLREAKATPTPKPTARPTPTPAAPPRAAGRRGLEAHAHARVHGGTRDVPRLLHGLQLRRQDQRHGVGRNGHHRSRELQRRRF